MKGMKFVKFLRSVCLIRAVCNHLIGEEHAFIHRAIVGGVVMVGGVLVAESGAHTEYEIVRVMSDTFGFALHGIGLVPIVEKMALIATGDNDV